MRLVALIGALCCLAFPALADDVQVGGSPSDPAGTIGGLQPPVYSFGAGVTPPHVGFIATREGINNNTSGAVFYWNAVIGHTTTDAVTTLQIVKANWAVVSLKSETSLAGAGIDKFTASVEYPPGTCTPFLFSGVANGTIAAGGTLASDALAIAIPANTAIKIHEYGHQAAGLVYNSTQRDSAAGDLLNTATTDPTDKTNCVTITQNASATSSMPDILVGLTTKPTIAVVGDSIAHGFLITPDPDFRMGLITPSIPTTTANVNLGSNGECAEAWVADAPGRTALFPYASNAVMELGTNDIHGVGGCATSTSAQLIASNNAVAALFPAGVAFTYTTIMGETASTDGWTTLGAQSADAKQSVINTYNAAVAGGTITSDNNGFFDTASVLQAAGIYDVAAAARSGLCSMTSGSNVLTTSNLAFVSTDIGLGAFVTGAGAASANLITVQIASITSGTAAPLTNGTGNNVNAGTTQTSVACKIGAITWDGTHPNNFGDALIPPSGIVDNTKFHYP